MLESFRHRRPDGENIAGFFNDKTSAFLGKTRMARVDIEQGQQPLANEDGKLAVVFSGEIYNHKELRSGLAQRGYSSNSLSDVAVVSHFYEE